MSSINNLKAKIIILLAVSIWASAFVGIRAGLVGYTPGGLAFLRFLIASLCMVIVVMSLPTRVHIHWRHKGMLLVFGAFGVGLYNITLNYGEIAVTASISSFIVSLSPLVMLFFAFIFLKETIHLQMIIGTLISIAGVALIMLGEVKQFNFQQEIYYLFIAMFISGIYSVLQKPFLSKYHSIEVTAYIIWGATILLAIYLPEMVNHFKTASLSATLSVVYLGVFPAALGYVGWSYGLQNMPASEAANYLYFMPIIATLLGWIWLREMPTWLSLVGGLVALLGVYITKMKVKRS